MTKMQLRNRKKTMKQCEYCKKENFTDIMIFRNKQYYVVCEFCYAKHFRKEVSKEEINAIEYLVSKSKMIVCDVCKGVGRVIIDFMNFTCGKCNGMGYILTKNDKI